MIALDHTLDILTGGTYTGNETWNKQHSDIDNCFKLYQIVEGELFLSDENEEYLLKKGGVYFINGSKLKSQRCIKYFSTHWLHFIPKDLVVHYSLLAMPLVVDFAGFVKTTFQPLEEIERLISNHPASYQTYYLLSLKIQICIQSMIVFLLEQYPLISPHILYSLHTIEPAMRYMKEHFAEPVRLKQLAGCCKISPNYFHKLFTQALQTTPTNYIGLLRMNAALPLLLNNQYTIKEIAYRIGFSDDAYFSRVFKKHYNITPGEYRKRRKNLFF